ISTSQRNRSRSASVAPRRDSLSLISASRDCFGAAKYWSTSGASRWSRCQSVGVNLVACGDRHHVPYQARVSSLYVSACGKGGGPSGAPERRLRGGSEALGGLLRRCDGSFGVGPLPAMRFPFVDETHARSETQTRSGGP